MTNPIVDLAIDLMTRESVTPEDAGCQALIAKRLEDVGFTVANLPFEDVTNLWARRGDQQPVIAFAGHTDVVPTGPVEQWSSDPFQPTIVDGLLYGRGAADMKSSLAAMVIATERFTAEHPNHRGSIAFLITSDEEGVAANGTVKVIEHLARRGEKIDACVIGEPSSSEVLGDVVRVGRRGSLNGTLRIRGEQGHVAYPEQTENPIHAVLQPLEALASRVWDRGNTYFPPTSFQISNITAGTGATNVIPGDLEALFNFRFNTEQTVEGLQDAVESAFRSNDASLGAEISWHLSGLPFITERGMLTDAVTHAIKNVTGIEPELSTSGGTSDGRFIAPTGTEVVELGPINASIHKIDENVRISDLEPLAEIYFQILLRTLVTTP